MEGVKPHLQDFCEIRSKFRNKTDPLRIWESNMPMYYLPSVNVFPDLIHHFCSNYDPVHRAVMSPAGEVLFYITPQSINEMLQFKPTRPLVPLSLKNLIDQASKLPPIEIDRIAKLFMPPDCYSRFTIPYLHVAFTKEGKMIIGMISYILGFRTSVIVDSTIFALMSIFTPRQPPAVQYDYATFIADKIHEQFMRLERERVFKYTSYIYHFPLYYQSKSFPVVLKKLDARGERRSVIFWSSIFHHISYSPYTYYEFIDLFIYPATYLLSKYSPPRLTDEMCKRFYSFPKATALVTSISTKTTP